MGERAKRNLPRINYIEMDLESDSSDSSVDLEEDGDAGRLALDLDEDDDDHVSIDDSSSDDSDSSESIPLERIPGPIIVHETFPEVVDSDESMPSLHGDASFVDLIDNGPWRWRIDEDDEQDLLDLPNYEPDRPMPATLTSTFNEDISMTDFDFLMTSQSFDNLHHSTNEGDLI